MIHSRSLIVAIIAVIALSGCKPELDPPTPDPGRADFSKVVVLGGSVLAGYQDGALYPEAQENSLGALLAGQMQQIQGGDFSIPLLPSGTSAGVNPKPWESEYQSKSSLGTSIDCEDVSSLGPVKTELSAAEITSAGIAAPVSNMPDLLAFPGAEMNDLTNPQLGAAGPFYTASFFWNRTPDAQTKSPLAAAIDKQPTFVVMNPGLQDIFNYAATGAVEQPTPNPVAFHAQLDSMLGALTASGAKGVLGNIPDVGNMPFFTTIPARSLELSQSLADSLNGFYQLGNIDVGFVEGENGWIVYDSSLAQPYRQMNEGELICLTTPLDSMRCFFMGILIQVLPDRYTLLRPELNELRAMVAQMNASIAELAAKYDFALADVAGLYNDLNSGLVRDGVDINTDFVSGNFFSLDGYGPTPKGAGLLANVYIAAINDHFQASVPTVRLDPLRAVLFP